MLKGECLLKAHKTINEDRQDQYGNPEDNFNLIAEFWNIYLDGKYPNVFPLMIGQDVAMMMSLLKVARIATGKYHPDNYVDIYGYAALADGMQAREGVVVRRYEDMEREVGVDMDADSKVRDFVEAMQASKERPGHVVDMDDVAKEFHKRRDEALRKYYGDLK